MKLGAVVYLEANRQEQAQALSHSFDVPMIAGMELGATKGKQFDRFLAEKLSISDTGCAFLLDSNGLALHTRGTGEGVSIRADFHGATVTYRRNKGGGKGQMIAKAVGLGSGASLSVLDATAGLGGDAFVLASLGCEVTLLERVPEVRALLMAGLQEAEQYAQLKEPSLLEILQRMRVVPLAAQDYLREISDCEQPDVVYLDPMFPEPGKRAMVKKEMRVFHELVGGDADADELLELALAVSKHRVVVKRPRLAAALAGRKPSHTLQGKRNRYDVYTMQKMGT